MNVLNASYDFFVFFMPRVHIHTVVGACSTLSSDNDDLFLRLISSLQPYYF
jgi:hypothetical protein